VERRSSFFRGSELPRLLFLAAIMIVGWAVVWNYAQKLNHAAEPELLAGDGPEPVVADKSVEFETVTDRTALGFRDNAAYSLLLERARGRTADELATIARRDVVLAHLWQTPELYRGVPIHLLGTALRVLQYPSKLSPKGWLYEAWIITPETTRAPYVCVFEDPPAGFPIGPNVSERVVFNGYFLKVMKYQAGDTARGAPVLVGRIGWQPSEAAAAPGRGDNSLLRWTLIILGVMFFASLVRWIFQLRRFLTPSSRPLLTSAAPLNEEIDPVSLDAWVRSVAPEEVHASHDREDDGRFGTGHE
jgi:hypothetical protein